MERRCTRSPLQLRDSTNADSVKITSGICGANELKPNENVQPEDELRQPTSRMSKQYRKLAPLTPLHGAVQEWPACARKEAAHLSRGAVGRCAVSSQRRGSAMERCGAARRPIAAPSTACGRWCTVPCHNTHGVGLLRSATVPAHTTSPRAAATSATSTSRVTTRHPRAHCARGGGHRCGRQLTPPGPARPRAPGRMWSMLLHRAPWWRTQWTPSTATSPAS